MLKLWCALMGGILLTTSGGDRALAQNSAQPAILSAGGALKTGLARPPIYIDLKPSATFGYTPSQIRHVYGFDRLLAKGIKGKGQTIAVIDAYGNQNIENDLDLFCNAFGLPLANGQLRILGNNVGGNGNGWDLETSLDVEWAHAIAPDANIILSVANSNVNADLLNAVDAAVRAGATVVAMSWGSVEFPGEISFDNHFNIPGVSFTAASGDNGAGVEWPAVSAYVLGVGGTSLSLDSKGNRIGETAWLNSGGGPGSFVPKPGFQNGWHNAIGRGVPDVSYVGDPSTGVSVYCSTRPGGPWFQVGGTSVGPPQWGALIALANSASSSGRLWTGIYSLAQGPVGNDGLFSIDPSFFTDVSSGNNGGYDATPRYDFVTGLGSPKANNLVRGLVRQPARGFTLSVHPVSRKVQAGNVATFRIKVLPSGGFTGQVALAVRGLPNGATASFNPNPISIATRAPQFSVLSINTSKCATPRGRFSLTISVLGDSTHAADVTIVVNAPSNDGDDDDDNDD